LELFESEGVHEELGVASCTEESGCFGLRSEVRDELEVRAEVQESREQQAISILSFQSPVLVKQGQ
jgi:hypothetical protein